MDRLLETLLSMARREGNLEINVDARNIVAQTGSSSPNISGVINLEFGFHRGYVHPKTVVVPPPVLYWWLIWGPKTTLMRLPDMGLYMKTKTPFMLSICLHK